MKLIRFLNHTFLHDETEKAYLSDYVIFYSFLSTSLLSGLVLMTMILGGM